MRHTITFALVLLLSACNPFVKDPVANPDPNHTHADFAVWIDGKKLDFSDARYMSTPPAEEAPQAFLELLGHAYAHGDEDDGQVIPGREYLHLHDGNGHVIHRHKPGLTIGAFFSSIGFTMTKSCLILDDGTTHCTDTDKRWRMFVNDKEGLFDPDYVFEDLDKILLTFGSDDAAIEAQLKDLTDDACRYSKTCPERGDPPAEGCIADPAVPCLAPLE